MIVVMKSAATEREIEIITERLKREGFGVHLSRGVERTVIGAIGNKRPETIQMLEAYPFVERVVQILKPYKLVGREFHPQPSVVEVGDVRVGGGNHTVIAGPCAVESAEQLFAAAEVAAEAGADMLRGGAYKPRTSPYSFQGLAEEGLELLAEARERTGLPVVTEVMRPDLVETVARYADVLQIGTRNMQNYPLLEAAARSGRPVLLKRGMSATIQEWLLAAEYVVAGGNRDVILCERGIRTFETTTRFTLDVVSPAVVKELSHLPVIVDPSHAAGHWKYVTPTALGAVAAGADGLIVEIHPSPEEALCDGPQALRPERFVELMAQVRRVREAVAPVSEPVAE